MLVPASGIVGFLPGMPPRSISDRQSYVAARIDYLNYLASTDAYLVGTMDNPRIANLKVLIPRVLLLVRTKPNANSDAIVNSLAQTLKVRPLEVRELKRELKKVGGDMFIFLALENMRIYLVGGVLLALIAILAIASTNYSEDRRTLGCCVCAASRRRSYFNSSPRVCWRRRCWALSSACSWRWPPASV